MHHDCFIAYISTKKDDFSTKIFWEFSYYLLHQGTFVLFRSEHTLKHPLLFAKKYLLWNKIVNKEENE